MTYQGKFWSLRTGQRFRYKGDDGPGPAAYSTNEKTVSSLQKYQDFVQSENSARALVLRSNDILQRRLCREVTTITIMFIRFKLKFILVRGATFLCQRNRSERLPKERIYLIGFAWNEAENSCTYLVATISCLVIDVLILLCDLTVHSIFLPSFLLRIFFSLYGGTFK